VLGGVPPLGGLVVDDEAVLVGGVVPGGVVVVGEVPVGAVVVGGLVVGGLVVVLGDRSVVLVGEVWPEVYVGVGRATGGWPAGRGT
jgi:hypothetical protein